MSYTAFILLQCHSYLGIYVCVDNYVKMTLYQIVYHFFFCFTHTLAVHCLE